MINVKIRYFKCKHKRLGYKTIIQQLLFKNGREEYYHFGKEQSIEDGFSRTYEIIEEIEL